MTLRTTLSAMLAAVGLTVVGCGPAAPDYQSIWSTAPATTTTTTPTEAPTQSFADYLESVGVVGRPVAADKLTDLSVAIPVPDGWQPYVNQNLAPGTRTITKGDGYPSAMLVVFELTGQVNAAEVVKHADADAKMSENFKELNSSLDNFRGFPSSMIEGSYDLQGQRMQSYNRVVIATGKPTKPGAPGVQYLVQLTVTSFADEAQADGPDIEAIIRGFTVKAPA